MRERLTVSLVMGALVAFLGATGLVLGKFLYLVIGWEGIVAVLAVGGITFLVVFLVETITERDE